MEGEWSMAFEGKDRKSMRRREFLKRSAAAVGAAGTMGAAAAAAPGEEKRPAGAPAPGAGQPAPAGKARPPAKKYNDAYSGARLNRVAFPLGGIGAGMICLEGTGALSHFSLRQKPEVYNEPCTFAALAIRGKPESARVLEGPVPGWKLFGQPGTGNGAAGTSFGLPRFRRASFRARFPFATVRLSDPKVPLDVEVEGWSPFEPGDADGSSLPAAALEYRLKNRSRSPIEGVFSFNAKNFLAGNGRAGEVRSAPGGFVLRSSGPKDKPGEEVAFAATSPEPGVQVNCAWFRGGWWDPLTMAWKDVREAASYARPPVAEGEASPGATLFVPFSLAPGASRTIVLQLTWYMTRSGLRIGQDVPGEGPDKPTHQPWYAGRFAGVEEAARFFADRYGELREKSRRFSDAFHDSTLPAEVVEAVAANLTIIKSPTVLRQADGRLWSWEGCGDSAGCCHGSCTHVWNYAQAIPHLFPALERSLRETEFGPSQDETGHQAFRTALPIRPTVHDFHAAADGQLGGILKVFRDWRVSGDTEWLKKLWPKVKQSLNFAIDTWDPGHKGVVEEPHHNTYDIEFWGPDGMCSSFYLGALKAASLMGRALGDEMPLFAELYEKGARLVESELYNGEYFIQKIEWKNLKARNPLEAKSFGGKYSREAEELLQKEGPKYQYGTGCLADGVLGSWLAMACGVGQVLDREKVKSHLRAIHRYNLKKDLSEHSNPQRPSYAAGTEGGLLICTWPRGGALSLPFVYSDEVWTGIEYQVASHLMMMGLVEEGLEIVQTCRDRYDGRVRNPFNEYECGHWYARAMSSYGLLQGLTGARYDAVEKVLYLEPSIAGDFRSFIATAGGYGTVGVKDGKPFLEVKQGTIEVKEIKHAAKA